MVDHDISAHFEINASQVAAQGLTDGAALVRDMVTTRMAAAANGGQVTDDGKERAIEVYVMTLAMLQALSELGVLDFTVKAGK